MKVRSLPRWKSPQPEIAPTASGAFGIVRICAMGWMQFYISFLFCVGKLNGQLTILRMGEVKNMEIKYRYIAPVGRGSPIWRAVKNGANCPSACMNSTRLLMADTFLPNFVFYQAFFPSFFLSSSYCLNLTMSSINLPFVLPHSTPLWLTLVRLINRVPLKSEHGCLCGGGPYLMVG